jgi:hypothetical protein
MQFFIKSTNQTFTYLKIGDLIPTRRWKICERDVLGNIKFFTAILQGETRSKFNTSEYSNCMLELTGFSSLDPVSGGGTFVTHHMIFNKACIKELLELMTDTSSSLLPWPLLIMSQSKKHYRFSEYKTYATFMLRKHPTLFHYHDLYKFGEGGLRFRDADIIISEMLQCCKFEDGGLSFYQVRDFIANNWGKWNLNSNKNIMPAYIQLDRVYGLSDVDLKLTTLKKKVTLKLK